MIYWGVWDDFEGSWMTKGRAYNNQLSYLITAPSLPGRVLNSLPEVTVIPD